MSKRISNSVAPAEKALRRMHLPIGLIRWIKAGTLAREVRAAFKQLDELNVLVDAWEKSNPDAAKLTPWFSLREAWKAAGRPQPHWIEALKWRETYNGKYVPIGISEVEKDLLVLHMRAYWARRKMAG